MTDREKLIKLLKRTEYQFTVTHSLMVENVADDLLQNGVTFATDTNVGSKVETNVFDVEEIHHNCTVQILRNSVTGEQSIGWWPEEQPPKEV